jgi:hypothetical protein
MKYSLAITLIISFMTGRTSAQQNWAGVPCTIMKANEFVDRMIVDSLHNEIILYSVNGDTICNTIYKGLFAYNGNSFHDLDRGLNTHEGGPGTSALYLRDCITYGNKTLFGGFFNSVGSTPLYAKSLALWNGAVWDTFPKHIFRNVPSDNTRGGFFGFTKWNGKLWMYGGFDTIGSTITKNLVAFDGNAFLPAPSIPVNNNAPIVKMIEYKNKLIAFGNFYDTPNFNYFRLAQFDGTSWLPVGTGVRGGVANVCDMKIYKDTLYIAGSWSKGAGNAGNYIMKWDGSQLLDAAFTPTFCSNGNIWSLIPFKNRLYAFGNFLCAANQKAFGVAYYENGAWTVPQDSIASWAITSAVLHNNSIYIAGGFKSINGDTTIQKFARLMCPDFDAASGCLSGLRENSVKGNVKVFPNPSYGKLNIEFNGIVVEEMTFLNTLGQEVYKLFNPSQKQEIDISVLPAGIYFLIAENKLGQGMFKVLKE